MSGANWPPADAIAITLRIGNDAPTSIATKSARQITTQLRVPQTAMGSAQLVATELQRQLELPPAGRATLVPFGESWLLHNQQARDFHRTRAQRARSFGRPSPAPQFSVQGKAPSCTGPMLVVLAFVDQSGWKLDGR
jgi:hypothetical protein